MKEEALKLADSIDEFAQGGYSYKPSDFLKVSAMIRRLVEELDKQGSSIWDSTRRVYENCQCDSCKNKEPQTNPLSDEEIKKLMEVLPTIINTLTDDDLIQFARAIEERHGIK